MNWLKQPGIVKKLQVALVISVAINICLLINSIPKKETVTEELIEKKEIHHEISEIEIKSFIKEYLNYFFSTGLVAQSFIKKHSETELFLNDLKPQLEMRTQKNLNSNFNILDFYIEPQSQNSFQVILVGIESFQNKDYQNREITLILNLEKDSDLFKVNSIPKFEVKA